MSLTLYYHPLASYCHKVLIALYELGAGFEKRVIDLGKESDRSELRAIWPIGKFPVLRDHARGHDVPESSTIIEYVDCFYSGPLRLIPTDADAAIGTRLWDRFFDNYVQTPMQEIVADRLQGAGADLDRQRALLETAYRMIDDRMASRTWAGGGEFGMADCAAAPALFYAATVQPLPADAGNLDAYFERLMARPSVLRVLEEAKPYFGMYPFAASVPARFR